MVQTECYGKHQQFESVAECVTFYDSLEEYDQACLDRTNGVAYSLQGNTTLCRFLHHFMMHESPEMHCYHVGKGGKDGNGKIKCAPSDCVVPLGYKKKQESVVHSPALCTTSMQADAEMRLSSVLPHCLGALRNKTCTRDCKRALRQFGLSGKGPENVVSTNQNAVCHCRDKILQTPLSPLLSDAEIDPTQPLFICSAAEGIPVCRGTDGTAVDYEKDWCQDHYVRAREGSCVDLNKTLVEQLPAKAMKSISEAAAKNGGADLTLKDIYLVDVETVREILEVSAANATESVEDKEDVMIKSFGYNPSRRPWVTGGSLLLTHAEVLEVMKDPSQIRRGGSFNRQSDANEPIVLSRHTATQVSSASLAHELAHKLITKAWPMLAKPQPIVLKPVPESLKKAVKRGTALGDLSESTVQDVTLYVIESQFDHLFPNNSGLTDELKNSWAAFAPVTYQLTSPRTFHKISGGVGPDVFRIIRGTMADWIKDYYGETKMDELAAERRLTVDDAVDTLVDITWTNVVAAVGRVLVGIIRRIFDNPCPEIEAFKSTPRRYIVEHIRLAPPVPTFSFQLKSQQGTNASSLGHIYSANRDPAVFQDPLAFNPNRSDLFSSLGFNALGSDYEAGSGASLTRPCPARSFSLRMTEKILLAMLPEKETMDIICYEINDSRWFDWLVNFVIYLGATGMTLFVLGTACAFSLRVQLHNMSCTAYDEYAALDDQLIEHAGEMTRLHQFGIKSEHENGGEGGGGEMGGGGGGGGGGGSSPGPGVGNRRSIRRINKMPSFFLRAQKHASFQRAFNSHGRMKSIDSTATSSSRSSTDGPPPESVVERAQRWRKMREKANRKAALEKEKGKKNRQPSRRLSVHLSGAQSDIEHSLELVDISAIASNGKRILDHVDITFKRGLLTAVMGGSGAGKSTLLDAAAMRLDPSVKLVGKGIFCDDHRVASVEETNAYVRTVGYVPQELDLAVELNLTCTENMYVHARMRWDERTADSIQGPYREVGQLEGIHSLIVTVLRKFRLLHRANTLAADLSGGERRRLAIAIECLRPNPVLFLDEPTTGQDAKSALELVRLLSTLAAGDEVLAAKTVVMIIHQPRTEIFALVDEVVLLAHGRVVYAGTPSGAMKSLVGVSSTTAPSHAHNLADEMMDACQSLSEHEIIAHAQDVRFVAQRERAQRTQGGRQVDMSRGTVASSTGNGENERTWGQYELAPLFDRVATLVYKRHWTYSFTERVTFCEPFLLVW